MKRITCFLVAAFLCLCAQSAGACTSFAVYSPAPLCGMNWDYPETPAYLRLNQPEEYHKVFSFGFETEFGMATNGSMNDQGFIAFIQDEYPRVTPTAAQGDNSVEDMHDFAGWTPYVHGKAQDILDMLDGGTHVSCKYYTMHDLFADASGGTFVLEEYEGKNVVTKAENGVLVMTNFPNHFVGQVDLEKSEYELRSEYGFDGVDRYKTVHEIIAAHRDDFDVATAFEALQEAAQYGYYRTRYSGVYDPNEMVVYVALERDYDHIWKISLTEGTVETYLGFGEEKRIFPFAELCEGDLGIPFEKLMEYEKE